MIRPPNLAAAYPDDYLAYVRSRTADEECLGGTLFSAPRDPGITLGRQGDENFLRSVLIGRTRNGQHIILMYAPRVAYEPDSWQYGIAPGAEWEVVHAFPGFEALREFLCHHVA